jgi:hypothetical protein
MKIFQKSEKFDFLMFFVFLISTNWSFSRLSGEYILLKTSSLYTDAFKKLLIWDVEPASFGIAWVKNDPIVVNDMKTVFLELLCFRYKLEINNIFMLKTFV